MTRRAPGVCRTPGCLDIPQPGRATCRQHSAEPWAGSADTRARLLPADYSRIRRHVRRRARHRCERCGARIPHGQGQVDHRIPLTAGGPSTPANLWLLCDPCAAAKTRRDLAALRKT